MDDVRIIDIDDLETPAEEATEPCHAEVNREFLLAGEAHFSVTNPKNQRMLYVVKSRAGKRGTQWSGSVSYFLRVFDPTANTYRYVGVIQEDGTVVPTGRSEYTKGTFEFDIGQWAITTVFNNFPIRDGYKITHSGKCGKCARMLTETGDRQTGFHLDCTPTPESL